MTTASLSWEPGQDTIAADMAATIAMDRAGWEAVGAEFTEVDDGDGERPGLAVGMVDSEDATAHFGVLDYAGETTHLLVPGEGSARSALTLHVIGALIDAGVLPGPEAVLEIIGLAKPATVDAKIEYLADVMQEQFAVLQHRVRFGGGDPGSPPSFLEHSRRLADTLRDLVTIRGTVQLGEREEPVELVDSESDLQVLLTSRSTGSGSLRISTPVAPVSDVDLVVLLEAKPGEEPIQMVLDGLSEVLPGGQLLGKTLAHQNRIVLVRRRQIARIRLLREDRKARGSENPRGRQDPFPTVVTTASCCEGLGLLARRSGSAERCSPSPTTGRRLRWS